MHVIRGGLSYNLELRWDGVPSLADGLRMLKEQAQRTPPGQWVRVIGGLGGVPFSLTRVAPPAEINSHPPPTPLFLLLLFFPGQLYQTTPPGRGLTQETPHP